MQFGHALVVAAEKSREILRQVLLVEFGERTDDAEIEQDVMAKTGWIQTDLDIAGMHVGVKKPIPKYLCEKDHDAIARQFGNVDACRTQTFQLRNGHTIHALHYHHFGMAEIPEHLGNQHIFQFRHVAAQLGCIGSLPHQVEFVVQVFVELGHHFARLESLAISRQVLDPPGQHRHQRQVLLDHATHRGTQYLDGDFAHLTLAIQYRGEMHLGNRCAGHRRLVERFEDFAYRPVERTFDRGHGDRRRKRRHAVLQSGQLV